MLRFITLSATILLIACCVCQAQVAHDLTRDTWMSVYLGQNVVGILHTSITTGRLLGKNVHVMRESLVSRFQMESKKIHSESVTTLYFGDNLKPILGVYDETDNGAVSSITARFLPGKIDCKITANGKSEAKIVRIPSGADLSTRVAYETGLRLPEENEEYKITSFDPARMAVTSESIRSAGKIQVDYLGGKRDAALIHHGKGRTEVIDSRLYTGELAISDMPGIGARMIATTMEQAKAELEGIEPDLDLVPVDKPIPNPRRVTDLTLLLIGMPGKDLIRSDLRQKAEFISASNTAVFHVVASSFDPTKSAKLPIKRADLAKYLKPTDGIECADKAIISQAKKIVANEKSSYRIACKLREWVQTNVKPLSEATTTLSAIDTYKQRTGCCRHNAVLYAALARAAGIPTRLAAGLIYDSGSFRFHVWNESWVGAWTPFDPTYPGDFVDATHIKLVEGGIETLPSLGRAAGRLRAEIVGSK